MSDVAMLFACGAVIAAAVVAAAWLKRAGEREWAEVQRRVRLAESTQYAEIREAFVRFQVTVRDQMTPALERAAASMTEMARRMSGGAS